MRKKVVLLMMMAVALMALPAMAQTFGAQQAEQPNAVFQSTSTMSGSGSSYSANPTLNADGTAAYSNASYSPAKAPGGPHRAPGTVENPDDEPGYQTPESPLGDAVLPLMLMLSIYFGIRYYRRNKSVKELKR